MTDKAISPLRRRLIEDMTIRRLSPKTHYQYIRHVKKFADFLGRSADKATAEDVHRYQLWLASIGTSVGTASTGQPDRYGDSSTGSRECWPSSAALDTAYMHRTRRSPTCWLFTASPGWRFWPPTS